jgi:hypothetical protein
MGQAPHLTVGYTKMSLFACSKKIRETACHQKGILSSLSVEILLAATVTTAAEQRSNQYIVHVKAKSGLLTTIIYNHCRSTRHSNVRREVVSTAMVPVSKELISHRVKGCCCLLIPPRYCQRDEENTHGETTENDKVAGQSRSKQFLLLCRLPT